MLPDLMNVMFLPLWVPTSLLKFVGSAPALLDADIEAVKTQVSRGGLIEHDSGTCVTLYLVPPNPLLLGLSVKQSL